MASYPNLKILHISSEKTWRGGEQQIAYLIEELERLEIGNVVFCKSGSAFESWCIKNSIKYYTAHFTSNLDLKTSLKIRGVCRIEQPHLIHTHSSRSHSLALYSNIFGKNIPLVVSRRVDFQIKSPWKYNHESVKKIICVSGFIQQMVQKKIRRPERCITIYSGVDINRFQKSKKISLLKEYGFDPSYKSIGNTSAIADHKDYFTFINTAEIVLKQRSDVVFFIIGDGPMKPRIEEYIKSRQLSKNVILTGHRTDIPDLLPSLNCFLITSKTEGLGTSILDAMAAGVPVVATKAGGIPEIVIHEKTGLLAKVGDAKNLADHVIKILTEEDLVNSLLVESGSFIENFSYQQMAKKTLEEYTSIL